MLPRSWKPSFEATSYPERYWVARACHSLRSPVACAAVVVSVISPGSYEAAARRSEARISRQIRSVCSTKSPTGRAATSGSAPRSNRSRASRIGWISPSSWSRRSSSKYGLPWRSATGTDSARARAASTVGLACRLPCSTWETMDTETCAACARPVWVKCRSLRTRATRLPTVSGSKSTCTATSTRPTSRQTVLGPALHKAVNCSLAPGPGRAVAWPYGCPRAVPPRLCRPASPRHGEGHHPGPGPRLGCPPRPDSDRRGLAARRPGGAGGADRAPGEVEVPPAGRARCAAAGRRDPAGPGDAELDQQLGARHHHVVGHRVRGRGDRQAHPAAGDALHQHGADRAPAVLPVGGDAARRRSARAPRRGLLRSERARIWRPGYLPVDCRAGRPPLRLVTGAGVRTLTDDELLDRLDGPEAVPRVPGGLGGLTGAQGVTLNPCDR